MNHLCSSPLKTPGDDPTSPEKKPETSPEILFGCLVGCNNPLHLVVVLRLADWNCLWSENNDSGGKMSKHSSSFCHLKSRHVRFTTPRGLFFLALWGHSQIPQGVIHVDVLLGLLRHDEMDTVWHIGNPCIHHCMSISVSALSFLIEWWGAWPVWQHEGSGFIPGEEEEGGCNGLYECSCRPHGAINKDSVELHCRLMAGKQNPVASRSPQGKCRQ